MSRLSSILRGLEGGRVAFWCPGCNEGHQITVSGDGRPRWGYNGNPDTPTFTPSILVRGVRLDMPDEEVDKILEEYGPDDREKIFSDKRIGTVCHSFVEAGKIRFLNDCTHALAGKIVDIPAWPGHEKDASR